MSYKKILHLTLKKEYFDAIALGYKSQEYREYKLHWIRRLLEREGHCKEFDEIHFRNGYHKNSPFMRVEFGIMYISKIHFKDPHFVIGLGKVLEIKNWKRPYFDRVCSICGGPSHNRRCNACYRKNKNHESRRRSDKIRAANKRKKKAKTACVK